MDIYTGLEVYLNKMKMTLISIQDIKVSEGINACTLLYSMQNNENHIQGKQRKTN